MNVLILTEEQMDELTALNEDGSPDRQLVPTGLDDGRLVLNSDLLNDHGPGQTWEHYGAFLDTLELANVTIGEFVTEEIS